MFIQTEATPNPETLKFLPGSEVLPDGTANFDTEDSAKASPLAEALFGIADVRGVFLGKDFVTVTKKEDVDWSLIKPAVLTTIMEHFISGRPIMSDASGDSVAGNNTINDDDDELVKQIKELLDTRVRPAVAEDGGDIIYHGFDDGIVKLEMRGACAGCPSSTATLKHGIENMLRHYVPEVESVEAV